MRTAALSTVPGSIVSPGAPEVGVTPLGAAAGLRFFSLGCKPEGVPGVALAPGVVGCPLTEPPSSAFRFFVDPPETTGLVARLAPGDIERGVGLPALLEGLVEPPANGLVALLPEVLPFSFGAALAGGDVARFATTEWPPIPRGDTGVPSLLTFTVELPALEGAGDPEREPDCEAGFGAVVLPFVLLTLD